MAFFFKQPGPTPRDLSNQNKWRSQQSADQREQQRRFEKRRALKQELKAAGDKARGAHRALEHILHEAHHLNHEDEHSLHAAEMLDEYAAQLAGANTKTHTEVHTAVAQLGRDAVGPHSNLGGIEAGEMAVFQLITMCIVLIRRVALLRSHSSHEKAKQHAKELKGSLDRLGSVARRR
jgi:hypothetical protein